MLNKNIFLIFVALAVILLPSAVSALVTCNPCEIDGCVCQITECSKGIFNVFTISDCSGVPYVRDTFSGGIKTWYPQNAIDHYILVLCDDGSRSACVQQRVSPIVVAPTTTTTTKEKTTTTTEFTETTTEETGATYTTEEKPSGGGFNFLWIILIFIIVGVVFFFLRMRKKGMSYEEVYKKWSR